MFDITRHTACKKSVEKYSLMKLVQKHYKARQRNTFKRSIQNPLVYVVICETKHELNTRQNVL